MAATVRTKVEKMEAKLRQQNEATLDRILPQLTDDELEALAAMPGNYSPETPEAKAALLRIWRMFTAEERDRHAHQWKTAGVIGDDGRSVV